MIKHIWHHARTTIAAGIAVTALCVTSVQAETIRLNHNLPADSTTGRSFEFFAERVKQLTDGDLRVRVFHAGQLGGQRESIELVQQGALDMAKSNTAEMEAFEELYAVFNIPYIFTSGEHARAVLKGEVGQKVLAATEEKGFMGLGFLYEGSRSFYSTTPIKSLEDLQGKKIRVQPSPSAIRMVELLGANPAPISFGELYSALQQGVVDGAENTVAALTSVRHGEVAKHYMRNEHSMIPAVYVISTKTWNKLSEAHQKALRQAADETFDRQFAEWSTDEQKDIKIAKEKLGVTFYDVDKAPFIKAVEPMIEEAAANAEVAEMIKTIQSLSK